MTPTLHHEVHATLTGYACSADRCGFRTSSLTEVAHHVVTRQYPVR